MTLTQEEMNNYTVILHEELIPAMGCTEPIAIAYAAAKAKSLFKGDLERFTVNCSGNIIKNVKGVTVPNSGGQKGIPAAAALGIVGGDSDKALEVIAGVTDEDREACRNLVERDICEVTLAEGVANLYIDVTLYGRDHMAEVIIDGTHTNIVKMVQDGTVLLDRTGTAQGAGSKGKGDRTRMTFQGLIGYARTVDLEAVKALLETQMTYNTAISDEGLTGAWGAEVGRTLLETYGSDVKFRAVARAAAGSDARMSGCPKPVVINSGSGNQGITVSLPVITYAEAWKKSHDETLRALIVSNLVSIYIKHYIGPLSAFCGAVSASTGAGAAITFMATNGDARKMAKTVTNTLANVGGILCDGAKPSCAAKIASSLQAALMAHAMSMKDRVFKGGEGIVEKDIEDTIRNIGYIGKIGMKGTDTDILNVMIGQIDPKDYVC